MRSIFFADSKSRNFSIAAVLSAMSLFLLNACHTQSSADEDAQVSWLKSSDLNEASVNKALSSKLALQINLKTNRMTVYKDGRVVDQWNIASADVSGEFHDKIPQSTPTGIFAVEDMQACPEWLPRAPKNPKTGKVAANEAERRAIFKENSDLFGPCGSKNPLGSYVIWFHGEYGVHGNAAEWILELAKPDERRVSGGCIRNPNAKIKDLFHRVIDSNPELVSFKQQTQQLEQSAQKKTITQSLNGIDMKVVVGHWASDSAVGSVVGASQSVTKKVETEVNSKSGFNNSKCIIVGVDSVLGIAPTHEAVPGTPWNMLSFYSKGDEALVQEEVSGSNFVKTVRGFLDKKFIGSCKSQD